MADDDLELVFDNGEVRFIHNDDAVELLAPLGAAHIARASHVEPDGAGQWWADLAPLRGPMLGPFARRDQALAEEAAWISRHLKEPRCGDCEAGP